MTTDSDKIETNYSPLCRKFTQCGITVDILIYEDGQDGWLLEIEDEKGNSTVWDMSFETDDMALEEALTTIKKIGIKKLVGGNPDIGGSKSVKPTYIH